MVQIDNASPVDKYKFILRQLCIDFSKRFAQAYWFFLAAQIKNAVFSFPHQIQNMFQRNPLHAALAADQIRLCILCFQYRCRIRHRVLQQGMQVVCCIRYDISVPSGSSVLITAAILKIKLTEYFNLEYFAMSEFVL